MGHSIKYIILIQLIILGILIFFKISFIFKTLIFLFSIIVGSPIYMRLLPVKVHARDVTYAMCKLYNYIRIMYPNKNNQEILEMTLFPRKQTFNAIINYLPNDIFELNKKVFEYEYINFIGRKLTSQKNEKINKYIEVISKKYLSFNNIDQNNFKENKNSILINAETNNSNEYDKTKEPDYSSSSIEKKIIENKLKDLVQKENLQKFKRKVNTDKILISKANILAPVLFKIISWHMKLFVAEIKKNKVIKINEGDLLKIIFEVYSLYLHYIDREQYAILGNEKRIIFGKALITNLISYFNKFNMDSEIFINIFTNSQIDYGKYTIETENTLDMNKIFNQILKIFLEKIYNLLGVDINLLNEKTSLKDVFINNIEVNIIIPDLIYIYILFPFQVALNDLKIGEFINDK